MQQGGFIYDGTDLDSHLPLCAGTHGILVNLVQYDTAPYEQHYIVRMNGDSHDASYAFMMSGIPMFVRPLTDGMSMLASSLSQSNRSFKTNRRLIHSHSSFCS